MSVTLIVIVLAVVSALVGIKVYLEHTQEKQIEETKIKQLQEEAKKEEQIPVAIEAVSPIAVENPVDFKTTDPNPALETPKKKTKKRYYGKPGKKADKKPFENKKKQNKN
jgi:hypothetical protein